LNDIRHRVGIAVPRRQVYEMFSTKDGLVDFWTQQVEGDSEVGGKLSFFFGRPERSAVMEVVALAPDEQVQWRCVEGPPEWVGTMVTFDLKDGEEETVVLFTHAGWREPVEFMHHCSTKWATLLVGLRGGLEGGSFTSFPADPQISKSWG